EMHVGIEGERVRHQRHRQRVLGLSLGGNDRDHDREQGDEEKRPAPHHVPPWGATSSGTAVATSVAAIYHAPTHLPTRSPAAPHSERGPRPRNPPGGGKEERAEGA